METVSLIVDVVTLGVVVVLVIRNILNIGHLQERQQSTQTAWKQAYENTNKRVSDHIQSRMHEDK